MSVFHALSAGKTGQPAMLGPDAGWTGGALGTRVVGTGAGARRTSEVLGTDMTTVVEVVDVVVVSALVEVVDGTVATDSGRLGSAFDTRPELHAAASAVTTTPAVNAPHRFDRFGITDLVPDTPPIHRRRSPRHLDTGHEYPPAR